MDVLKDGQRSLHENCQIVLGEKRAVRRQCDFEVMQPI